MEQNATTNLILSGLMGIFGGLITLPLNAVISWWLKREEQDYQYKLDILAKRQELLLQHKLEIQKISKDKDIEALRFAIAQIEEKISHV